MVTLTSIELFAGGGGMALGTQAAGFEHLALLEWNEHAVETLRANSGGLLAPPTQVQLEPTDVRSFDFGRIDGQVDLIAAGAPCQPFSLGGRHAGHEDNRNLFPEVFRAQRTLRPRALLLENVRGLMRPAFRPYLEYIVLQVALPGLPRSANEDWRVHKSRLVERLSAGEVGDREPYHVAVRTVDCASFGVPQRRHRVFMVATPVSLGEPFDWPDETHSQRSLRYSQYCTGEYWKRHGLAQPEPNGERPPSRPGGLRPWRTVRDALAGVPEPEPGVQHEYHVNHTRVDGARSYPGHTGSPWDEPAKTLKAGVHGVPGGENMLRREDGTVRYFTVHESALLQSFPPEYIFSGSRSEAMRQIGNAAPTAVCRRIAESLGERLRAGHTADDSATPMVDLVASEQLQLV